MRNRNVILTIAVILASFLSYGNPAQAAMYFFTVTYLGGGSCGVNAFALPGTLNWSFPPPTVNVTTSGTFSVNGAPATAFPTVTFSMGASSGSITAANAENMASGANTGGSNTYSYSETDSESAAGIQVGTQIITVVCTAGVLTFASIVNVSASGNGASWNPSDGRVDPHPWDRLVIWCNIGANPPNVDVWGVDNTSHGFRLHQFVFADLAAAGSKGQTFSVGINGTISLNVDAQNHFYAAWNGGQYSATGRDTYVKSFSCPFPR